MWLIKDNCFYDDEFPFFNLVTTKNSGDMKDGSGRLKICSLNGIDPGSLVCAEQVHGSRAAAVGLKDGGRFIERSDGLITGEKNTALAIFTADCVPVFLGADGKAAGVAHAGWRGLLKGIIPETVKLMTAAFGIRPAEITAAIGPHICRDCYTIGDELRQSFGLKPGETNFDLGQETVRQLKALGVTRISLSGRCTCHETELFFSHRKDKTKARIMSLIRF